MKVYITNKPETLGIATSEDDVRLKEVRMWFKTDEEIEVLSLSDYTKRVRKEVAQEIKEKAYDLFCDDTIGWLKREEMFLEYLDQIQGEDK